MKKIKAHDVEHDSPARLESTPCNDDDIHHSVWSHDRSRQGSPSATHELSHWHVKGVSPQPMRPIIGRPPFAWNLFMYSEASLMLLMLSCSSTSRLPCSSRLSSDTGGRCSRQSRRGCHQDVEEGRREKRSVSSLQLPSPCLHTVSPRQQQLGPLSSHPLTVTTAAGVLLFTPSHLEVRRVKPSHECLAGLYLVPRLAPTHSVDRPLH